MKFRDSFPLRQARSRPLASFAAMFLLGLVLARSHPLPLIACIAALAALLIAAVALRRDRRFAAALLLAVGLVAGIVRMTAALDAVRPVETRYSVEMTGRVVSEPYENPKTGRVLFKFQLETADGAPDGTRVRLYLRGDDADALAAVAYGQRLRLTGHIWAADPVTNPYEFDFGAYLRRQGLTAYATAKIEDVEILGTTRDIGSLVVEARQAIARRIDALFPSNAGMMRALVLGDRTLLGEDLRDALSRTGTAHLISISGLHVTVLAALLTLLLGLFLPKRIANLVAVALLIPYGALIGFTAPFVRALAMFAILSFAPAVGRPSDSVTRLSAVLLAFLLVKPENIDDAGFALSFSATAGLLLLTPPLMRWMGLTRRLSKKVSSKWHVRALRAAALYLPSLLCASLAAQLASLPVVIAFFGVQPLISLPFNLVCVPLCMAGYLLGLVALLLSVVSVPLAALLARVPDALFGVLAVVAGISARLPASGLRVGRYPMPLALLHWCVILVASDLSRVHFSRRRWLVLAVLAVAGMSSLITFARAWPFSVTFLDADQADCAVVSTRGHTYLIDTGDTYTPVGDYLNATCLGLDGVFLSHPHQDHAGGLNEVLDSFTPGAVYVPAGWFEQEDVAPAVMEGIERAEAMGVPVVELSMGDEVPLSKDVRLTVYSPDGDDPPTDANDLSLLTLIEREERTVLFTGDLTMRGEPEAIPQAEVLKVAHHGADNATSERFLAACEPDIAIISVGQNNFGHPGPDAMARLDAIGAAILQTRDYGAITLTPKGGEWRVTTYLEGPDELE